MDNGLWITWYDLPEDGRDAYLSWLHERYIPRMLDRPGVMWAAHYASVPKGARATIRRGDSPTHQDAAAVPAGDRYLLLFGAAHAHVFGDPTPAALHAAMAQQDRRMLAMRSGERVNIMCEAARLDGPDAGLYVPGTGLAPCIQLGSFNCDWRDEEEMLAWYAKWRMPALGQVAGVVRTRKLASVAGWAKHAILYEWTSLEARNRGYLTHEDHDPEMKAWSDRMVKKLVHAPGSANLACRIWPPVAQTDG